MSSKTAFFSRKRDPFQGSAASPPGRQLLRSCDGFCIGQNRSFPQSGKPRPGGRGTSQKTSFGDPELPTGNGSRYIVTQYVCSKHEVKTHGFYTCFILMKHGICDPDDLREVKMAKPPVLATSGGGHATLLRLPLAGPGATARSVPGTKCP